jgi:lipopolysaccharide export system permease protein
MRLLDRYLLRELLIPLVFCLSAFLILWHAFDLINHLHDFQTRKLHARDVLEYYLAGLPENLVFFMPFVLLLSLLYTLTNHARHNELTAIRAAGVSLWRLSVPYFAVGLLFTIGYFAMNELWAPRAEDAAEEILNRRVADPGAETVSKTGLKNLGFENRRDGRIWQFGAYNPRTYEMFDLIVSSSLPDGARGQLIAKRGVWTNHVWVFYNGREQIFQPASGLAPSDPFQEREKPEFSETPEEIKSEIKIKNRNILRSARSVELPISEILDYLRFHPKRTMPRPEQFWLYTQLQGRLAAPWTCLVVVLIALPFGAASGRRNVFVGVAGSIAICFAYFILLKVGLALGTGGYIPSWVAGWLPNVSFAATGLCLTLRAR